MGSKSFTKSIENFFANPCQFMKYFTYNILCTSNLPKNNEELESTSEIVQNDISTSKNNIALILTRAG